MTYSIESLLFKAAVGVVNTAARAANGLLEVMYPKDIGHIWEEPAVGSCTEVFTAFASTAFPHTYFCELPHGHAGRHRDGGCEWTELAAPCADPHPADAADPAGGTPPPPAGSPLTELRAQVEAAYKNAQIRRKAAISAGGISQYDSGRCMAYAAVLGMLDALIDEPTTTDGPLAW